MAFRERDIFRQRLSSQEIRDLLAGRAAAQLFSWKSPRARELGLWEGSPPDDDTLISLMAENPYLIRRPLVSIDSDLVIGLDTKRLETLLP